MARKKKTEDIEDIFDDASEKRRLYPTGIFSVDAKLGGGIPEGVSLEVYGPTGSGKTSLGYSTMGQIQKAGIGRVVLFDVEGSFNADMAIRCGLDEHHVNADGKLTFRKISQPAYKVIENIFSAIKQILYSYPDIKLIMVDSVAGTLPQDMTGDDANLNRLGMLRAKLYTDYIPLLNQWIEDTGNQTTVLFVNHEKEDISFSGHGPPKTTTPAGKALKYYASMRLEVRAAKTEKEDIYDPVADQKTKQVTKIYVRVQATKNRFFPPFRPATFIFNLKDEASGIDRVHTLIAYATAQDIIHKGGGGNYTVPSEISGGSEIKCKGKDKLAVLLEENAEVYQRVEEEVVRFLNHGGGLEAVEDTPMTTIDGE